MPYLNDDEHKEHKQENGVDESILGSIKCEFVSISQTELPQFMRCIFTISRNLCKFLIFRVVMNLQ